MLRVHLVNLLANLLGPQRYGSRIRIILYNAVGNRIALRSRFAGGGYVYGTKLTIGERSYVGRGAYFDLTDRVTLEEDVVVGHGVTFVTADHAIGPRERRAGRVIARPVHVGRGAWIGANATIMPGVRIGCGAIVAAGSLVRGDVAADAVVAGVPARVVRDIEAAGDASAALPAAD